MGGVSDFIDGNGGVLCGKGGDDENDCDKSDFHQMCYNQQRLIHLSRYCKRSH